MNTAREKERFLNDIAKHSLHVLRDDGVNRHVRFKQPGTVCMSFDLITWPGYLCYTGDMGTYVFRRLEDMFEFFRTDRKYSGDGLSINLSYWSEKLVAIDGARQSASVFEFDEEKYTRIIKEQLVYWMRHVCSNSEQRKELRHEVEDQLLDSIFGSPGSHSEAVSRMYEFEAKVGAKSLIFQDAWENNMQRYTHRFIWCCYALAWGIKQYDDVKSASEKHTELNSGVSNRTPQALIGE